jgi:Trp operon repressor
MIPIRKECPPGACSCQRVHAEKLLADPQADLRILRLTKEEEAKLLARLEALQTLPDLHRMQERLQAQLGIVLTIAPGPNEVQTVRGFHIQVEEQPGLCRKTKQAIPAAVRRCLEARPAIAFEILDADGLWAGI